MSRSVSGAVVVALLLTPALAATPAGAQPAPHAATVVRAAAAPGVEVGPVRVVLPRCGSRVSYQDVVTDRQGEHDRLLVRVGERVRHRHLGRAHPR
ncbi:MAG: hypothetical protein U0R80_01215 [Nocardioidaceae bacterium]